MKHDNNEKAVKVYDKIAESYVKEFSTPSEYIDEFLSLISKNGKILDVGCGVGVDSNYMKSKGFAAIGIDMSKEMLRIAKQKYPQIDFRLVDMRKIDFPPNSFSGIVASCSLIHIPKKDVPILLKKFNNILKNEGVLYIALQGGESKEMFINEPFKPDEKLFLNIISFDEIKRLLAESGFIIISKYEREAESEEELNFIKLFVIAKKLHN